MTTETEQSAEKVLEEKKEENNDTNDNAVFKSPTIIKPISQNFSTGKDFLKENSALQAFAYHPPEWQAIPPAGKFYIDVIKNGVILETIKLDDLKHGSYIVFGRFPPVDIQLDHPSVSRQHLVLQYGNLTKDPTWYLYDLNSTHGTKLNKKPVPKQHYEPIRIGYVFQVAGSSRVFSFCGKDEEILDEKLPDTPNKLTIPASITLDDDKLMELQAMNEEDDDENDGDKRYFEKDPVGWLEKYFDREGLSMNFEYTTEGKEVTCSIELPDDEIIDGGSHVSATGTNRKEAQLECALSACERLEENGLLRVFSIWNKRKTYAENDYYDSDEDIYFDRTGQIEEQRRKRKLRCEGNVETVEKAKNFDELSANLLETEGKLEIVRSELRRIAGKDDYLDADGKVNTTNLSFSTRMAISQMRTKEKKYIEECNTLKKLVELTRPRDYNKMFPPKKMHLDETKKDVTKTPIIKEEKKENLSPKKETLEPIAKSENMEEVENLKENEIKKSDTEDKYGFYLNDYFSDPNATTSNEKSSFNIKQQRNYAPASLPPANYPKFGVLTKAEALIKKPSQIKQNRQQQKMDEEVT